MTANNNKLSATDLANRISVSCSKGYITKYSEHIPSVTIHAYNRLIEEAGWVVGWENQENHIIDKNPLIEKLEIAIPLFERAQIQLIQSGLTESTVNGFSPVDIVEFGLSVAGADKDLIITLANSNIYCSIALLEMTQFREMCGRLIDQQSSNTSKDELYNIVLAQSRLIAAQEAISSANQILYRADNIVRGKISSIDEVRLQLEIERRDYGLSKGGRSSHWRGHQATIERHLRLYLQDRKFTQEDIIELLEKEIGSRPPKTTFSDWLKRYKVKQAIF